MEQIKYLEIDLYKYIQLIFDKGAKATYAKRTIFSENGAETIRHSQAKKKGI